MTLEEIQQKTKEWNKCHERYKQDVKDFYSQHEYVKGPFTIKLESPYQYGENHEIGIYYNQGHKLRMTFEEFDMLKELIKQIEYKEEFEKMLK